MNRHKSPVFLNSSRWGSLRIAGVYLLIGILWILFSDRAVERIGLDPATLTTISIYKGWGFILVTAIMLYWLIQRHTAELGENESRLRLITDAMPALISYVDSDLRYRFSNQAYEEWFGHKPNGKKIDEVLGLDAYRKIARYVDEALSGRLVNYQMDLGSFLSLTAVIQAKGYQWISKKILESRMKLLPAIYGSIRISATVRCILKCSNLMIRQY